MPPTPGRTGRPPVTSRPQILAAARRLIDTDGWDRLTVRRLAAELGIGPTTLYHHVRDKGDLLLLLLNEAAAAVTVPELPAEPAARIVAAATVMHDVLADWPWAVDVLATDGFLGLLDSNAVQLVETIVAAAVDAGLSPDQAVHVFRGIWYYTVGEILVRVRSHERRPPPGEFGFDAARTPALAAVGQRWPQLAAQDTYTAGLTAMTAGLLQSSR
ncbi:TetR/AcrR family transcriptional regulator [Actinoplanes couchii]|uniref:TetR family transcriptional regulator n=1 Tax=Actinoplanes couchii TaxID=403638 RepID=A0ABQ3XLR2_9ACTN|nr:TetR/AcrR family transcriptional regulator [Actinoplanes couchii]MDR6319347.1 AcrR family transcriptional regulator [Actinoplanes couchii]GID59443.1 TetR family transcriptional regulator [Actinoplanes couchii]